MTLLYEALTHFDIPMPKREVTERSFTRWGRNARYWARKVGEGYIFGDYVANLSESVFPNRKRLSALEMKRLRAQLRRKYQAEDKEQLAAYENAHQRAVEIWKKASAEMESPHAYLKKKGVGLYNIRVYRGFLLLPLHDEQGKIWSLQFIDAEGNKRFLKGGRKKGCFLSIGTPKNNRLIICEGYATGASIHEATGDCVIVSFDAGNLQAVARALRRICRAETFIFAADNDVQTDDKPNKGVLCAEEACQFYGGRVVIPQMDGTKCDFNDIYIQYGSEAVRQYFDEVIR